MQCYLEYIRQKSSIHFHYRGPKFSITIYYSLKTQCPHIINISRVYMREGGTSKFGGGAGVGGGVEST